jgi:MraZ protein
MLIGEYKHTLDSKKRISIPAKFRRQIGKTAVITRGLDKCLFVYSMAEWKKVAELLSNLPTGQADTRNFVRLFLSGAVDVAIDSLGRILIPDYLKDYAELKGKAVITGVYKRVEIWDDKKWE